MGAHVIATDISPIAVQCAKANAIVNNLEDQVRVLEGDPFEPIQNLSFDLLISNPPCYRGKPSSWAEYAWRSEVLERFLQSFSLHMKGSGRVLLPASTELDLQAIEDGFWKKGFELREICARRTLGETLYVFECMPICQT